MWPSFLSLLSLSDRCFLSKVVYKSMKRGRGGRLRPSRTLQRGGRARSVVSHETESPLTDGVWGNYLEATATLLNFAFPVIPRKQYSWVSYWETWSQSWLFPPVHMRKIATYLAGNFHRERIPLIQQSGQIHQSILKKSLCGQKRLNSKRTLWSHEYSFKHT